MEELNENFSANECGFFISLPVSCNCCGNVVWKLNVHLILEKILYFKYWTVLTVILKEMLKMESN